MCIKIVLFVKIYRVRLQNIIKLFSHFYDVFRRGLYKKLFIMILNLNKLEIPN